MVWISVLMLYLRVTILRVSVIEDVYVSLRVLRSILSVLTPVINLR